MLEATSSILIRAQRLRAAMLDSTSAPQSAAHDGAGAAIGARGAGGAAGGSLRASLGETGWCERFDWGAGLSCGGSGGGGGGGGVLGLPSATDCAPDA